MFSPLVIACPATRRGNPANLRPLIFADRCRSGFTPRCTNLVAVNSSSLRLPSRQGRQLRGVRSWRSYGALLVADNLDRQNEDAGEVAVIFRFRFCAAVVDEEQAIG